MRHLAAALIFIACVAWIAASVLAPAKQALALAAWNWIAAIGAGVAFFAALSD